MACQLFLRHLHVWHHSLPPQIRQCFHQTEDFYNHIFPDADLQSPPIDFFTHRAILTTQNDTDLTINNTIFQNFRREEQAQTFESVDSCDAIDDQHHPVTYEFLKALLPRGFPQSTMKLKVGVPDMLLRNINASKDLCNGKRLIVTRLHQNCIAARIIGGAFNGRDHVIFRIKLSTKEGELRWTLTRKQFLIRLCFAITINKSQGQSLAHVGIDLRSLCFSHGQFYVAGSRGPDSRRICVLLRPRKAGDKQDLVENVVYPEVLLPRIIAWKEVQHNHQNVKSQKTTSQKSTKEERRWGWRSNIHGQWWFGLCRLLVARGEGAWGRGCAGRILSRPAVVIVAGRQGSRGGGGDAGRSLSQPTLVKSSNLYLDYNESNFWTKSRYNKRKPTVN